MSFNVHNEQLRRTAFFHLPKTAKIRPILSEKDGEFFLLSHLTDSPGWLFQDLDYQAWQYFLLWSTCKCLHEFIVIILIVVVVIVNSHVTFIISCTRTFTSHIFTISVFSVSLFLCISVSSLSLSLKLTLLLSTTNPPSLSLCVCFSSYLFVSLSLLTRPIFFRWPPTSEPESVPSFLPVSRKFLLSFSLSYACCQVLGHVGTGLYF